LQEVLRRVILEDRALVQEEDLVRVDDRVETMGDREDGRATELFLDQLLDGLFGDDVDVGSGFVQEYDLVASQDRSADANELLLAGTQTVCVIQSEVDASAVTSLFIDVELFVCLELLLRLSGQEILQASVSEHLHNLLVSAFVQRIKVGSESAIEDDRVLRNDGDPGAEGF